MKIIFYCLISTILILPFSSQSKENCDKALDSIPKYAQKKKMFEEIYQFKKMYSTCMDGAIAEGVSAVVVETLDKNWSQMADVEKIGKTDKTFKKFILVNIQPNVTGQESEVNSIIAKGKKSCPKNMKSFCRDLVKSCERSLKTE